MTDAEFGMSFASVEQDSDQPYNTRRGRRVLGEHSLKTMTFLNEIDTPYDFERNFLKSRVIGQDAAIDAIVKALDRKEVRSPGDHKPIANLAFLGPTGVGKTETAQALSEILAYDEALSGKANLIKIDCSNFQHGHEIASLIGAPPGYIGSDKPPIFSQDNITPGTVILFDEIEKGCDALFNVALQVMDKGLITPHAGKKEGKETDIETKVSFRDCVIIMTSNLGAREMARQASGMRPGFSHGTLETDNKNLEQVAERSFKEHFRPEFSNRFDNIVVFHGLDEESMHQVLEVKLKKMNGDFVESLGAHLNLSERTREYLVNKALKHPEYGARPLVRALDADVAANFGRFSAKGKIDNGTEVHVYHRDEVGDYIDGSFKNDLIFAVRPNPRYRTRPVASPSTDVVRFVPVGDDAIRVNGVPQAFRDPDQPPTPDPEDDPTPDDIPERQV